MGKDTLHALKTLFYQYSKGSVPCGHLFLLCLQSIVTVHYFVNVTTYQGFPTVMSLGLSCCFCFAFCLRVGLSVSVIVIFKIAGLTGGDLEPRITERPKLNQGRLWSHFISWTSLFFLVVARRYTESRIQIIYQIFRKKWRIGSA